MGRIPSKPGRQTGSSVSDHADIEAAHAAAEGRAPTSTRRAKRNGASRAPRPMFAVRGPLTGTILSLVEPLETRTDPPRGPARASRPLWYLCHWDADAVSTLNRALASHLRPRCAPPDHLVRVKRDPDRVTCQLDDRLPRRSPPERAHACKRPAMVRPCSIVSADGANRRSPTWRTGERPAHRREPNRLTNRQLGMDVPERRLHRKREKHYSHDHRADAGTCSFRGPSRSADSTSFVEQRLRAGS